MKSFLDIGALRRAAASGSAAESGRLWRSLDELADTDEFREAVAREFPQQAPLMAQPATRRHFLRLMGASLAMVGMAGCARQPEEKIVPHVVAPEGVIPGRPLFYATAIPSSAGALGLLVESHEGRPTKAEGNPRHPSCPGGATDIFAQAAVLSLYDPDRAQTVKHLGNISTWSALIAALKPVLEAGRDGAGIRLLTERVTSPTLAWQIERLQEMLPRLAWHQYEPDHRDNSSAGAMMAFGRHVDVVHDFTKADRILSLDADFLGSGPGHVRNAHDFVERRGVLAGELPSDMNRLFVVESSPSLTGARADHRLPLPPREIEIFAWALAARLGVDLPDVQSPGGAAARWLDVLARDLEAERGLVIAGESQSAAVHLLAHAMNDRLGAVNAESLRYVEPAAARPEPAGESLTALVEAMNGGDVDALFILGGNPVFTAPGDLPFEKALRKVPLRVGLSPDNDETAAVCHWHIAQTHFLEEWSDTRAWDGTISLIQPLIAPLYDNRSIHEVLAVLLGRPTRSGYDVVQDYWRERTGLTGDKFDDDWETALHNGFVEGSASAVVEVDLSEEALANLEPPQAGEGVSVVFRVDPTIGDGRFANNGWLQELPRPLTKVTWDNPALISPSLAEKLGLANEDVVEIKVEGRSVELPVWIAVGQAEDCVLLHFGNGRRRAGQTAADAGFNVYPLRPARSSWIAPGAKISKAGRRHALAATQHHFLMDDRGLDRHLFLHGDLEEWREEPGRPSFMHHGEGHEGEMPSMYRPWVYSGDERDYSWGMTINLSACIGCSACTIACQAENNIPVVGKEEVARGREMQWIRVDQYFGGDLDEPEIFHQPVPCMHCELAPCEPVCPVGATTHSDEGLNQMTYNRCVGTRYCANNCPYKVRRFNFFQYSDLETESLKLMRNPDVTVRNRGVMEKCTYCVQRISSARIAAEKEDRAIDPGEVVTACQAVCPTRAIQFGNLNNPQEDVVRLKRSPLNYDLLAEVGTRPRTSYLASLSNPHPDLAGAEKHGEH